MFLAIGSMLLPWACSPASPVRPTVVQLPPQRPSTTPTASASASGPALPPPATWESACEVLAREHVRVLAGSNLASFSTPRGADPPFLPAEFGKCLRTPGGAWGLAITAVGEDGSADIACWAVVHVDETGRREQVFPASHGGARQTCSATFDEANLVYGQFSSVIFDPPQLWDQDHDGEPELLVHRSGTDRNQELVAADTIWTFRAGVVEPYAPAREIGVIEWKDVDNDGVRDIITQGPFRTDSMPCCGLLSMLSSAVVGPKLLAHGRADGTFSLDDEAAREFARKQCPARPPRIGGRRREVGMDIGCALLWGVPPKDIVRNLAVCAPRPGEAYEPHCPEWCVQEKGFVESFSSRPAPLRLGK